MYFSHIKEPLADVIAPYSAGLHDLRYKAKILHRDISDNNVMFEWGPDGRPNFILIDFDMAKVIPTQKEKPVSRSEHRTGTLMFMAVDLIQDAADSKEKGHKRIPHYVRHEYESLLYLAYRYTVLGLTSKGTEERNNYIDILREWETSSLRAIVGIKKEFRKQAQWKLPLKAQKAGLLPWFKRWGRVFRDLSVAQDSHISAVEDAEIAGQPAPPFDLETMEGYLTRDNLRRALAWTDTAVYDKPAKGADEDCLRNIVWPSNIEGSSIKSGTAWKELLRAKERAQKAAEKSTATVAGDTTAPGEPSKTGDASAANKRDRHAPAARAKAKAAARAEAVQAASPAKKTQLRLRRSSRLAQKVLSIGNKESEGQHEVIPTLATVTERQRGPSGADEDHRGEVAIAAPGTMSAAIEEAQAATPYANSDTSGPKSRKATKSKAVRALKAAARPGIVDNEMRRKLRLRATSGKAAQV